LDGLLWATDAARAHVDRLAVQDPVKRRRHRRDASSKTVATTYLVVSYVPLLRGEAGATFELEQATDLLDAAMATGAGHVVAVVLGRDRTGHLQSLLGEDART
jgi:hypothetical protein